MVNIKVEKNGSVSLLNIVDVSEAGFRDICEQLASPVVICKSQAAAEVAFAVANAAASTFGKSSDEMKMAIMLAIADRAM